MTIGNLLRGFDPRRKIRHIVRVGKERKARGAHFLQTQQQCTGLSDRKSLGWGLRQHAHESEFGN